MPLVQPGRVRHVGNTIEGGVERGRRHGTGPGGRGKPSGGPSERVTLVRGDSDGFHGGAGEDIAQLD